MSNSVEGVRPAIRQPHVGDIVLFRHGERVRPAIVLASYTDNRVWLHVFSAGALEDTLHPFAVPHGEDNGMWRWPED